MGLGTAGGGAGDLLDIVLGAGTRRRGRTTMDPPANVEGVPGGAPNGLPCPRCGSRLRDLGAAGPRPGHPLQVIACPSCGFVGLREA
jgi:hypothetical protein